MTHTTAYETNCQENQATGDQPPLRRNVFCFIVTASGCIVQRSGPYYSLRMRLPSSFLSEWGTTFT